MKLIPWSTDTYFLLCAVSGQSEYFICINTRKHKKRKSGIQKDWCQHTVRPLLMRVEWKQACFLKFHQTVMENLGALLHLRAEASITISLICLLSLSLFMVSLWSYLTPTFLSTVEISPGSLSPCLLLLNGFCIKIWILSRSLFCKKVFRPVWLRTERPSISWRKNVFY